MHRYVVVASVIFYCVDVLKLLQHALGDCTDESLFASVSLQLLMCCLLGLSI